jgi:hypothetical protein
MEKCSTSIAPNLLTAMYFWLSGVDQPNLQIIGFIGSNLNANQQSGNLTSMAGRAR